MATEDLPAHRPASVRLPSSLSGSVVRLKPGWRVWPPPPRDAARDWPLGVHEKTQPLVREEGGRLEVPVCAGMIYRMAKSPCYVFAPAGMKADAFISELSGAELVPEEGRGRP